LSLTSEALYVTYDRAAAKCTRTMAVLFPFYFPPPNCRRSPAEPYWSSCSLGKPPAADPNREVVSALPSRALITRGGRFPRLAVSFDPLAISAEYLLLSLLPLLFSPSSGLLAQFGSVSQLRSMRRNKKPMGPERAASSPISDRLAGFSIEHTFAGSSNREITFATFPFTGRPRCATAGCRCRRLSAPEELTCLDKYRVRRGFDSTDVARRETPRR